MGSGSAGLRAVGRGRGGLADGKFPKQISWWATYEMLALAEAIDEDAVQLFGPGEQDEESQPVIISRHSSWPLEIP